MAVIGAFIPFKDLSIYILKLLFYLNNLLYFVKYSYVPYLIFMKNLLITRKKRYKICISFRFFDKCLQYIIYSNARMGVNAEHACSDATVSFFVILELWPLV